MPFKYPSIIFGLMSNVLHYNIKATFKALFEDIRTILSTLKLLLDIYYGQSLLRNIYGLFVDWKWRKLY